VTSERQVKKKENHERTKKKKKTVSDYRTGLISAITKMSVVHSLAGLRSGPLKKD
jgi:hypothetical protein